MQITLTINGADHTLDLDPRVTLLDALRDHLGLTGSRKGCDQGQCGACTVLVNGRRIKACLSLAVMHEGDAITTVEGLSNGASRRCNRPSSSMTASSAATAPPARSARPPPCSTSSPPAGPAMSAPRSTAP